ncbi:hypothetical protein CYMTET_42390 [Cymbomonas tetramitiformis]|uniref:Uncharacterized protein n=1 Tax=Cymbomonas tetramitiformis TaxID=36881 RepID=A0AAE0C5Y0_9CHLO|nr:hypothetical protein CYMTET_49074 [Cymbomonas tetramitiformis]KAK3248135.1 hypothetical protein CYMTET_42390 [Cymbomonas tetramitiformis]
MDPGAHYAKTPATPGLAITAATRKAIRLLRKEGFEGTVAKNVLSSVLGAKDTRFTAGEKHAGLIWLHLVEAIEKHFVNEYENFVDLFRLTDSTVECSEDANDLLYVTLEHLIKPGSDARAWLDSSGREFPSDGKRALLEISRRLDDQTEPLDALQLLIEIRFEANVDPDAHPPLAARSVVFEDSKPAGDPPRVAFTAEKTAKIIPTVKTTPTIVHNDERALGTFDKWANYVSPVLDMTPTVVGAHFDKFTLTADPFDETEDEDACETEDNDETAEVVSILPPEHVDLQTCPHAVYRNTDSLGGCRYYGELVSPGQHYELRDGIAVQTAAGAAFDATTPPQPPPPRQRCLDP